MSLSENVKFEDENDVAIVYGVRIGGSVLRALGEPTPAGQWFRIVKHDDGATAVEVRHEDDFAKATP